MSQGYFFLWKRIKLKSLGKRAARLLIGAMVFEIGLSAQAQAEGLLESKTLYVQVAPSTFSSHELRVRINDTRRTYRDEMGPIEHVSTLWHGSESYSADPHSLVAGLFDNRRLENIVKDWQMRSDYQTPYIVSLQPEIAIFRQASSFKSASFAAVGPINSDLCTSVSGNPNPQDELTACIAPIRSWGGTVVRFRFSLRNKEIRNRDDNYRHQIAEQVCGSWYFDLERNRWVIKLDSEYPEVVYDEYSSKPRNSASLRDYEKRCLTLPASFGELIPAQAK